MEVEDSSSTIFMTLENIPNFKKIITSLMYQTSSKSYLDVKMTAIEAGLTLKCGEINSETIVKIKKRFFAEYILTIEHNNLREREKQSELSFLFKPDELLEVLNSFRDLDAIDMIYDDQSNKLTIQQISLNDDKKYTITHELDTYVDQMNYGFELGNEYNSETDIQLKIVKYAFKGFSLLKDGDIFKMYFNRQSSGFRMLYAKNLDDNLQNLNTQNSTDITVGKYKTEMDAIVSRFDISQWRSALLKFQADSNQFLVRCNDVGIAILQMSLDSNNVSIECHLYPIDEENL